MASKVLTITVGNDFTKICEVAYSSQRIIHVYNAVTIPTPQGSVEDGDITNVELLANSIREAAAKNHMISKNVIFSMQSAKIASKEILTPVLKDDKLKAFITTNATEYFPVNIDDYVLAYSILERTVDNDVNKYRTMVVAAPVSLVEPYYELAEKLGYAILSIDYVGNSTLQLIRLQIDKIPTLVIQMGDDSTIVSILKNNVLQFMRTLPYGKNTVINALMEKRDIDYDKAVEELTTTNVLKKSFSENDYVTDSLKYLANNISRVMDYYTTKNQDAPIEKAFILTEGAVIIGIEDLFTYELNMKIEKKETLYQVMPEETLSMGLSELTTYLANIGAIIHPVNFIPKSAAEKAKSSSNEKYFKLTLLAAAVISVIIVVIPLISYVGNKIHKKYLEEQIAGIQSVQETVDAYYDAKDKCLDAQLFSALTINADDDLISLINYLEENMPSDISINSFSTTGGSITISCVGSSKETLAAFIMILKDNPGISDVYVASLSETADFTGAKTVSYSIVFNYAPVPAIDETTEEGAE